MSIAVSAVVRPSRTLFLLCAGMCMLVAASALAFAFDAVGELGAAAKFTLSGCCLFLACCVCYRTVQSTKTLHIDISGNGQIRLTEHSAGTAAGRGAAQMARLMAGSTLWPGLLLLRMQTEDLRVIDLTIMPDSVEGGGFRALAVACRWIAAHNNHTDHTDGE